MTNEQMEAMVESMCLTWRHDFGIEKPAPAGNWFDSIVSGTTLEERHTLRERMRQLVERHFKPALVALRAPVEQAPEWKLVPVEPTDDMIVAFAEAWFSKVRPIDDCGMEDAYTAMLAAAPSAPGREG